MKRSNGRLSLAIIIGACVMALCCVVTVFACMWSSGDLGGSNKQEDISSSAVQYASLTLTRNVPSTDDTLAANQYMSGLSGTAKIDQGALSMTRGSYTPATAFITSTLGSDASGGDTLTAFTALTYWEGYKTFYLNMYDSEDETNRVSREVRVTLRDGALVINDTQPLSSNTNHATDIYIGNSNIRPSLTEYIDDASQTSIPNPDYVGVKTLYVARKMTRAEYITGNDKISQLSILTSEFLSDTDRADTPRFIGYSFTHNTAHGGGNTLVGTISNDGSKFTVSMEKDAASDGYVVASLNYCSYAESYEGNSSGGQISSSIGTIYLVIYIENGRPYTTAGLQLADLDLSDNKSATFTISDFLSDSSTLTSTFATSGDIVKIPEFNIELQDDGTYAETEQETGFADLKRVNDDGYSYVVPSNASKQLKDRAYAMYTVTANEITITALHPSNYSYPDYTNYSTHSNMGTSEKGHFFIQVRVNYSRNPSDNEFYVPLAVRVSADAPVESTENNTSEMVVSGNSVGYFTPLSYTSQNGSVQGIGSYEQGGTTTASKQAQSLSRASNSYFINGGPDEPYTSTLGELTLLSPRFVVNFDTYKEDVLAPYASFFDVELCPIYIHSNIVGGIMGTIDKRFASDARVDTSDVQMRYSLMMDAFVRDFTYVGVGGQPTYAAGVAEYDYFVIYGLKVTGKASTVGKFAELEIPVVTFGQYYASYYLDTTSSSLTPRRVDTTINQAIYSDPDIWKNSTSGYDGLTTQVKFRISVSNTALQRVSFGQSAPIQGNQIKKTAEQLKRNDENGSEYYGKGGDNSITYSLYVGETIKISPYDLIYDADVVSNPKILYGGDDGITFNSNPQDTVDGVNQFENISRSLYRDYYTSGMTVLDSTRNPVSTLTHDVISIAGEDQLIADANVYADRFELTIDDSMKVPLIQITAKDRTPATAQTFVVNFTDGSGAIVTYSITVAVLNSKPDTLAVDKQQMRVTANEGVIATKIFTVNQLFIENYDTADNARLSLSNVRVVVRDSSGQETDGSNYVHAELQNHASGMRLALTALSCTQSLHNGVVYVIVTASDNYTGGAKTAENEIQVEVLNTPLVFATTNTRFTQKEGTNDYTWQIQVNSTNVYNVTRYIAFDMPSYNALVAQNGVTNVSLIATDVDALQSISLTSSEDSRVSNDNALIVDSDWQTKGYAYTRTFGAASQNDGFLDFRYETGGSLRYLSFVAPEGLSVSQTAPTRLALRLTDSQNQVAISNLLIEYVSGGMAVMEQIYSTTPAMDANIATTGSHYMLEYKNLVGYQIAENTANQINSQDDFINALKNSTLKLKESIQTQYFVYETNDSNEDLTKHFAATESQAFYYNGINVPADSNSTVTVPMSYFAVPESYVRIAQNTFTNISGIGDAAQPKVSFANLGAESVNRIATRSGSAINVSDSAITNISQDALKTLSITDGITTWSGEELNDNPYVNISVTKIDHTATNNPYLNKNRGYYSNSTFVGWNGTLFEDVYGLSIVKTTTRASTNLTLTATLELYNGSSSDGSSVISNVSTTVSVANAKFSLPNNTSAEYSVNLNKGDTEVVRLLRSGTSSDGTVISYTDADVNDTVIFDSAKLNGRFTADEVAYMKVSDHVFNGTTETVYKNLGVDNEGAFVESLSLNSGYDTFFDIAFSTSDKGMFTIVAKQKTDLNSEIPDDFTSRGLLSDDTSDKYYFPLRLVIYDDNNQTGMLNGSFAVIVIKVFINNSDAVINTDSLVDITLRDGAAAGAKGRKAVIAQDSTVSFNLADYISEPDILIRDGNFATKANDLTAGGSFALTHDYLKMPSTTTETSGNNKFTTNGAYDVSIYSTVGDPGEAAATKGKSISDLAVDINVTGSTINFKVVKMFAGALQYVVRVSDSNSDKFTATIVFEISSSNTAPEARTSDVMANGIKLRTGDSFELITTDKSSLETSSDYGFTAAASSVISAYPNGTADELDSSFTFDASGQAANHSLGHLVMTTDSAPYALYVSGHSFSGSGAAMFNVERVYNVGVNYYGYKFTARGVTSTTLSVTVIDEGGLTAVFTIAVNVISTAPKATNSANGMSAGVSYDVSIGAYKYSMDYGDSLTVRLDLLATDEDWNDNQGFSLTDINSISAVRCEPTTLQAGTAVRFTAVDFSQDMTTKSVKFTVSDAHGEKTDEITFIFTINPTSIETDADSAENQRRIDIKSYSDYQKDPNSAEFTYSPVSTENGTFFNDNDATAPSANYSLIIYSRLGVTESGFAATDQHTLIYKYEYTPGGYEITRASDLPTTARTLRDYFDSFLTFSLSADGKTLTITPVSASGENELLLRFSVTKSVKNGGLDITDTTEKSGYFNFTVANSSLTAVSTVSGANFGAYNSGQNFLEFSGAASSNQRDLDEESSGAETILPNGLVADTYCKRTYNLYNTSSPDLGLFRDSDILNNANHTTDAIIYTNFKIAETYTLANGESGTTVRDAVDSVAANDPVLSVSYNSENNSLAIVIIRRIKTVDFSSAQTGLEDSYIVPVVITATDRGGNTATVTVNVTISNHTPTFNIIESSADYGYTLVNEYSGAYVMNAAVEYSTSLTVKLTDIVNDYDYPTEGIGNEALFFDTIDGDSASLHDISLNDNQKHVVRNNVGSKTLFEINVISDQNANGISYNRLLVIRAVDSERNASGVVRLRIRDMSKGGVSPILTINLSIANTAPTAVKNPPVVNVLGNTTGAANSILIDVLDFVEDVNDNDALRAIDTETNPYFVYFDKFSLPATDAREEIFFGGQFSATDNFELCMIEWEDGTYHQKIRLTAKTGVYGYQKFTFTVIDSGYSVGQSWGVVDGRSVVVDIIINVLRPIEDYASVIAESETRLACGVTAEITPSILLDDNSSPVPNSRGYEIVAMTSENSVDIEITNSATDVETSDSNVKWYITAKNEQKNPVGVQITLSAGGKTLSPITFLFKLSANSRPVLKSERLLISAETQLDTSGMMYLTANDLLTDEDTGDVVMLIANTGSSQVNALIEASVVPQGDEYCLALKVKARGESKVTFKAKDATDIPYSYSIVVACEDAVAAEFFVGIIATYQSNPVLYWIITVGVVLIIVAAIIAIIIIRKRRLELAKLRMLEELGALDDINEQLGLGSGYESMNPLLGSSDSQTAPQGLNAGESDLPTVEIGAPVPGTHEYDMFIRQRDGVIKDDDEDDTDSF